MNILRPSLRANFKSIVMDSEWSVAYLEFARHGQKVGSDCSMTMGLSETAPKGRVLERSV